MSMIDSQRICAVKHMEGLGYTFDGIACNPPAFAAPTSTLQDEADAMHGLLVLRADKLEGCTEGWEEETEFKMIAETLEAYEAKRWPNGAVPGGKAE